MAMYEEKGEEDFRTVEGRESRTFGPRELLMRLKPGFGQVEVQIYIWSSQSPKITQIKT